MIILYYTEGGGVLDMSLIEINNNTYYEGMDTNENNIFLYYNGRIIARLNNHYCICYSVKHIQDIRMWAASFNIAYIIQSGTYEIL